MPTVGQKISDIKEDLKYWGKLVNLRAVKVSKKYQFARLISSDGISVSILYKPVQKHKSAENLDSQQKSSPKKRRRKKQRKKK